MRKATVVVALSTLLASGASFAAPAHAVDRFDVQLADTQTFGADTSTFTSNIPGCPTGTSTTERAMTQLRAGVFVGVRTFTCSSGIGSVTVRLSARFGEGGSVGTWQVLDGTDAFSGVHGAGKLVGTPTTDGIVDTYTGTVTVVG